MTIKSLYIKKGEDGFTRKIVVGDDFYYGVCLAKDFRPEFSIINELSAQDIIDCSEDSE